MAFAMQCKYTSMAAAQKYSSSFLFLLVTNEAPWLGMWNLCGRRT